MTIGGSPIAGSPIASLDEEPGYVVGCAHAAFVKHYVAAMSLLGRQVASLDLQEVDSCDIALSSRHVATMTLEICG